MATIVETRRHVHQSNNSTHSESQREDFSLVYTNQLASVECLLGFVQQVQGDLLREEGLSLEVNLGARAANIQGCFGTQPVL